jgi:hypothetical protein
MVQIRVTLWLVKSAWFKTGVVGATVRADVARRANATFRLGCPRPLACHEARENAGSDRRHGAGQEVPIRRRFVPNPPATAGTQVPAGAGPSTEHVDLTGFRNGAYGVKPMPGPR